MLQKTAAGAWARNLRKCRVEIDTAFIMQSEPQSEESGNAPEAPNREAGETATPESTSLPREYGGRRDGLEPTRYGDWEKNGRCIDF